MFLMNLASSSPLTLDKDLFKKFHTKEGLRLANQEAFKTLQEVDKSGEYWKEPEYENIFGYKKPKKSAKAFELLTRIESESQPEQVEKRLKKEKIENGFNQKLDILSRFVPLPVLRIQRKYLNTIYSEKVKF